MSFDALFDGRRDVIQTDGTLHQGQQARVVHGAELDVLEPAETPKIHCLGIRKNVSTG